MKKTKNLNYIIEQNTGNNLTQSHWIIFKDARQNKKGYSILWGSFDPVDEELIKDGTIEVFVLSIKETNIINDFVEFADEGDFIEIGGKRINY